MKPIIIVITSTIVGAIIIASVIYHYQRETTSIEDKYTDRSSAEIDDTYHQSYLDSTLITEDGYYSDSLIGSSEVYHTYYGPGGDLDDDGLTNAQEYQYGTNPNNPDSDGDGISDLDEINNGTDPRSPDTDGDGTIDSQDPEPTNPDIGGTTSPPSPPLPPLPDTGQLVIRDFYKNVRNISQGDTEWSNYIDAKPNDILRFFIYIDLENTSSVSETATLYDILEEPELEYNDSLQIIINDIEQPYSELLEYTWRDGYHITVAPNTTKTYEIYFRSITRLDQPNRITAATNIAKLVTNYRTVLDVAFIGINSF